MAFDRKGLPLVNAAPTAKLMVAWNTRPRFKDRTDGVWRRMLIVPFNKKVSEDRKVRGMDKWEWWVEQGEASGILLWAIAGLDRLTDQGEFTHSDVSQMAVDDYRAESNPASEFLRDFVEPGEGKILTSLLYRLYANWCQKQGYRPLGSRMFGKEVRRIFPKSERIRARDGGGLSWFNSNLVFSVDEIESMKTREQSEIDF